MNKELSPLEALEILKFLVHNYSNFEFDFNIIESALKRLEQYESETQSNGEMIAKKLKALNIIKEKSVNTYWFRYVQKRHKETEIRPFYLNAFEAYNSGVKVERRLTQEEYDLLKEVLL